MTFSELEGEGQTSFRVTHMRSMTAWARVPEHLLGRLATARSGLRWRGDLLTSAAWMFGSGNTGTRPADES